MHYKINRGFTLIELVIGMVVLAIAMMVMNTFFLSQSKDALEPIYRLRASQLGQSLMQNILSRAYDQKSDHNGGRYRCGEIWQNGSLWYDGNVWQTTGVPLIVACSTSYGPDIAPAGSEVAGEHWNFNDVDDFITKDPVTHSFVFVPASNYVTGYNSYDVKIVVAADNSSGVLMKRIDVTVRTPSNEEIDFSAFKGNY